MKKHINPSTKYVRNWVCDWCVIQTRERTQWVEIFATKLDYLSWIPKPTC